MKSQINERLVRRLAPGHCSSKGCDDPNCGTHARGGAGGIVYDSQVSGFGVRITPAGATAFVLNYSLHGRERRYTIGRWPEFSAQMARDEALRLRRLITQGQDPLADRERGRDAPTVNDLADEYLRLHAEPHKRPISVRDDKRHLNKHIRPRLGQFQVKAVTRNDLENLNRHLSSTPVEANRVMALLHKMFALAIEWGYTDEGFRNPAEGIHRYQETPRERWLQEGELIELHKALEKHPDQDQADAVRLILLTGARKSEVLSATWQEIDFERAVWTKPSHHTKQKRTEHLPLSQVAVGILRRMKSSSVSEYLFPGRNGGHLMDVRKLWHKVRKAAGVTDVRVHDLRHTYASVLVNQGEPLASIGKLLGHTQGRTTEKYAHLLDSRLRTATNQFSEVYEATRRRARKRGGLRLVSGGK